MAIRITNWARRALLVLTVGGSIALVGCGSSSGQIEVVAPIDGASFAEKANECELNSYSWEEISQIADEIAFASTDEEALGIAHSYGLVNEDGTLDRKQYKNVVLQNGATCRVRIAGFRHDVTPEGNVTGITFAFDDVIGFGGVVDAKTAGGGWVSSALREWLNTDAMDLLPEDLAMCIQPVTKRTVCHMGEAPQETVDALWLFSESELANNSAPEGCADTSGISTEGEAYQLFSESPEGTLAFDDAYIHENPESGAWECWWERSLSADGESFVCRSYGGKATSSTIAYSPNFALGIVPGFCI